MAAVAYLEVCRAVFWTCAGLLAFTFAGYPALMAMLAKGRPAPPRPPVPAGQEAAVTVLVVAHNEGARIGARLRNLLASEYPPEKLAVLVVSDGSTDDTVAQVRAMGDERVRVLALPERRGKAAGLNAGVAASTGDLIVFADARQTFAPDAVTRLAANLADPAFGAVSGELEIAGARSNTGEGVGAYWKLERFLRRQEARSDSCIGCTGAIYAIRRALFTPLPEDTVLDDVVIPMRIALAGRRVGHDPAARAFDPQTQEPAAEARRKNRTLAGNFQMLFRYPGWLLPWRNRLWWRLAAHKYLRLLAPFLLVLLLLANVALRGEAFYLAALLLQVGFYLLAAIGMTTHVRAQMFSIPAGFVFLNVAVFRALALYLFGGNLARWRAARG